MKILFFTLLFLPLNYIAQITPGRPGEGLSSDIVGKNSVVLENTFTYEPNGKSWNSDHLIRYGLTKRWELLLETYQDYSDHNESDYRFSTKYNLIEQNVSHPSLTVIGITDFKFTEFSALFASGYNVAEKTLLFGNIGYQRNEHADFLFSSLGLEYSFSDKWSVFTEYHGNYNHAFDPENNLEVGVNFLISERLQLNFSTGSTFIEPWSNYFLSSGFSYQIN